jgi:ribosome-associated protein
MPTKPKKSAAARPTPSSAKNLVELPDLLRDLVRALDAKKAEDLRVLRVTAQSSITDWLVLATGGSEPHLRALRIETERVLDAAGAPIAGTDGGETGAGWTVVDAYQIMTHLFTPEQRAHYALDRLWRDAGEVPLSRLIALPPTAPKPRVPRKSAARKKVTKKPASRAKPARKTR